MGQRGALCAVDESVHGHVACPGHTYGQELPQSQSRRSAQHPDPRVLPGAAGEFLSENVVSWPSSFADWPFFLLLPPSLGFHREKPTSTRTTPSTVRCLPLPSLRPSWLRPAVQRNRQIPDRWNEAWTPSLPPLHGRHEWWNVSRSASSSTQMSFFRGRKKKPQFYFSFRLPLFLNTRCQTLVHSFWEFFFSQGGSVLTWSTVEHQPVNRS